MKLYKDYKNEQELQKKEEEDRERIGIPKETAIIYEPTKSVEVLRSVAGILILILLLVLLAGGILFLALNSNL